jgi:hypothetical protein
MDIRFGVILSALKTHSSVSKDGQALAIFTGESRLRIALPVFMEQPQMLSFEPNQRPNESRRIFSWLLSESCDIFSNAVIYEYKGEDLTGISANATNERN